MAETIEGVIAKARKGQYGWGIQLQGRDDWYNEGKKLREAGAWPNPQEGDRVKLDLWTSDSGKQYINTITVLKNPANGKTGASERDDSISWNVALKLAGDITIANATHMENPSPITASMVLWLARLLWKGRPGAEEEEEPPDEEPDEEPQ